HVVRALRHGAGVGRRRVHLLVRVHVLPRVRRGAVARVPELRRRARRTAAAAGEAVNGGARHLYVHLPFCASRCGYCDFVTAVGRRGDHAPYVEALLAELAFERGLVAEEVETVFLGGGTPTFIEPVALARLLAALPPAEE